MASDSLLTQIQAEKDEVKGYFETTGFDRWNIGNARIASLVSHFRRCPIAMDHGKCCNPCWLQTNPYAERWVGDSRMGPAMWRP